MMNLLLPGSTIMINGDCCDQSDEGKGLGSCTSISLSQQTTLPSPAFVQSISVPQTEHRYLFPSWLTACSLLLLQFHGLTTTMNCPTATTGDDEFRPALFTNISLAYLICHFLSSLDIKVAHIAPEASSSKPYPLHCAARLQQKPQIWVF